MARLRFPGRPGQRFGRSLIRFMPEEARNCRNRFFNLTANIQKNLRGFYDLFGDSDEEDNFPGFTESDIGVPPDEDLSEAFNDGEFSTLFELPMEGQVSTRMGSIKRGLEALPTTDRTRNRLTSVVRRSYLDMHRGTDGSQRKTHSVKQVQIVKGKHVLNKVKNMKMKAKDKIPKVMGQLVVPAKVQEKKPKAIRFRFKLIGDGKNAEILSSPEKRALSKKLRKTDGKAKKNRAKVLLAKARQRKVQKVSLDKGIETVVEGKRNVKMSRKLAGMTGVSNMHFLERTTSPPSGGEHRGQSSTPSPARIPRQFVLPQKSSRSSRVIKPSKRFIEEMGVSSLFPNKHPKLDVANSRDVKQELLLSSGEEFVSPDVASKTLLKQKAPLVSSKKELFKKPKIVSTKVKKLHGGKHVKSSKTAQLVKKSKETKESAIDLDSDVEIETDSAPKVKKAFKLNSDKTKLVDKKRKDKIKLKKKKLEEKKRQAKQKKLQEKKKRKKELLKKGKSPKKTDSDISDDGGIRSGAEADEEDEDGIEDIYVEPKKDNKSKKNIEAVVDKKDKAAKETLEQVKKAKESPSKLLTAVMDIKARPRKARKSLKRKLKEEAKQLKKSYSELKKSIEDAINKPAPEQLGEGADERIPILEALDDLQRKNRLKELAKRHKEVCKALKKFQKDNIPEIVEKSKEVKKKKKKKDGVQSKTLADKILSKAKERIGSEDTVLQRDQKENVGPLKSPTATALLAAKSAALTEGGSSKAIADLICRQMAEAMEADMSPEQAQAASQREMKRRRQELKQRKQSKSNRGPRIKHVSRRASVALGYSPVRFTDETTEESVVSDFALSALSPIEKMKLLDSNTENTRWSSEDDGAKQQEQDKDFKPSTSFKYNNKKKQRPLGRSRPISKKHPFGPKKFKPMKRLKPVGDLLKPAAVADLMMPSPFGPRPPPRRKVINRGQFGARGVKCKECPGCLVTEDCGECTNCVDKPKFGGPGKKKQACIYRKCLQLVKRAPQADFSQHPRAAVRKAAAAFVAASPISDSPQAGSIISELTSFNRVLVPAAPDSPASNRSSSPVSSVVGSLVPGPSGTGPVGPKIKRPSAQGMAKMLLRGDKKKKGAIKELDLCINSPSPPPPKLKLSIQQELSKHLVKIDFKEEYDLDIAWMRGLAVISSQPMIPRTICYLCGSTGKHLLVYCNVCCEPFHEFCLDEEDRPLEGDLDKWCCRMCKFCSVCGRQDHLLTCAKCQTSYHAECLGPNYPTKPSKRRHIWVCTKCVKCKSCGATTPGQHSSAQWSHDFSLCQDCGKLFEKGNFCPVCKKCYEDDDYESKMMECNRCKSWVHAKCEGLSDDMYHIMTDLPETVPYNCVVCDPIRPARWQVEMAEEMQAGFLNVMTAVFSCKSASHLIWPDKRKNRGNKSRSSVDSSRRSTGSPALSDITSRSTCSTPIGGSCDSDSHQTPVSARPSSRPGSALSTRSDKMGGSFDSDSQQTPVSARPGSRPGSALSTRSDKMEVSNLQDSRPSSSQSARSDKVEVGNEQKNNANLSDSRPGSALSTRSDKIEVCRDSKDSDTKNSANLLDSRPGSAMSTRSDKIEVGRESKDSDTKNSANLSDSRPGSVMSVSSIKMEESKSDKMQDDGTTKLNDVTNKANLQGGTSLIVKQELLEEYENEPNGSDQTKMSIRTNEITSKADADMVPNSADRTSDCVVIESSEVPEKTDNCQSADSIETDKSQQDQPVEKVDEQRRGQIPSDTIERTELPVNESCRTSIPSVPEISCTNKSVLASVEAMEENSEVEIVETAITKETDRTESRGEPNQSEEMSKEKEVVSHSAEINEEVDQESSSERSLRTEEDDCVKQEKTSEDDKLTNASDPSLPTQSSTPHVKPSLPHTHPASPQLEAARPHVQTSLPHTQPSSPQPEATRPHVQMSLPHTQPSSPQLEVRSPQVHKSSTDEDIEQTVSNNENISEIDPNETPKTTSSTTAEQVNTESDKLCSVDQQSQSNDNSDQPQNAAEKMDTTEKFDVSLAESSEGTLNATLTPGSVNISRSESTDSAPETDIVEAVRGTPDSRRITRRCAPRPAGLTLVQTSNPLLPKMCSPPPMSNLLLSSGSSSNLGDESVMSLMASVIDKVMHGQPLNSLVVELQPDQNQVQIGSVVVSPPPMQLIAAKPEEPHPKDFQMVKAKVQAGAYESLVDFCNDCVRIIQASMMNETSQTVRKNNRVARTVFTKVMEKMFPWFKVNNSLCWEESVKYPDGMLPEAVLPPHKDHEYAQWKHITQHIPNSLQPSPLKRFTPSSVKKISDTTSEDSIRTQTPPPDPSVEDLRRCSLCGQYSDDDPNSAGRLLYCGQNDWIHINCALWSAEVYEEVDGSLINVHTAVSRGRHMKCDLCSKTGATVGCCTPNCPANYHFMCARKVNALFQEDKKVFCARHCRMVRKKLVDSDMFAVLRRVCVSFESMKWNKHFASGIHVNRINFMVGSFTLDTLGRLGPLSDTKDTLFPIDYRIQRVFWSTHDPRRRCVYTVRILEVKPDKISPRIIEESNCNLTTSHDPTYDPSQLQKSRMLLKIADPLSSSYPSLKKRKRSFEEDALSLSWPGKNATGLSEKTLRNLPKSIVREMSTPSSSPSPVPDEDGDMTDNLSQLVLSLNEAAASSKEDEAGSQDEDLIEAINIELDEDVLLGSLDADSALASVEKLIGEALSEDQSLDQVVLLVENLHNADDAELMDALNLETSTNVEEGAEEEGVTEGVTEKGVAEDWVAEEGAAEEGDGVQVAMKQISVDREKEAELGGDDSEEIAVGEASREDGSEEITVKEASTEKEKDVECEDIGSKEIETEEDMIKSKDSEKKIVYKSDVEVKHDEGDRSKEVQRSDEERDDLESIDDENLEQKIDEIRDDEKEEVDLKDIAEKTDNASKDTEIADDRLTSGDAGTESVQKVTSAENDLVEESHHVDEIKDKQLSGSDLPAVEPLVVDDDSKEPLVADNSSKELHVADDGSKEPVVTDFSSKEEFKKVSLGEKSTTRLDKDPEETGEGFVSEDAKEHDSDKSNVNVEDGTSDRGNKSKKDILGESEHAERSGSEAIQDHEKEDASTSELLEDERKETEQVSNEQVSNEQVSDTQMAEVEEPATETGQGNEKQDSCTSDIGLVTEVHKTESETVFSVKDDRSTSKMRLVSDSQKTENETTGVASDKSSQLGTVSDAKDDSSLKELVQPEEDIISTDAVMNEVTGNELEAVNDPYPERSHVEEMATMETHAATCQGFVDESNLKLTNVAKNSKLAESQLETLGTPSGVDVDGPSSKTKTTQVAMTTEMEANESNSPNNLNVSNHSSDNEFHLTLSSSDDEDKFSSTSPTTHQDKSSSKTSPTNVSHQDKIAPRASPTNVSYQDKSAPRTSPTNVSHQTDAKTDDTCTQSGGISKVETAHLEHGGEADEADHVKILPLESSNLNTTVADLEAFDDATSRVDGTKASPEEEKEEVFEGEVLSRQDDTESCQKADDSSGPISKDSPEEKAIKEMETMETLVGKCVTPSQVTEEIAGKLQGSYRKLHDSPGKLQDSSGKLQDSSGKLQDSMESLAGTCLTPDKDAVENDATVLSPGVKDQAGASLEVKGPVEQIVTNVNAGGSSSGDKVGPSQEHGQISGKLKDSESSDLQEKSGAILEVTSKITSGSRLQELSLRESSSVEPSRQLEDEDVFGSKESNNDVGKQNVRQDAEADVIELDGKHPELLENKVVSEAADLQTIKDVNGPENQVVSDAADLETTTDATEAENQVVSEAAIPEKTKDVDDAKNRDERDVSEATLLETTKDVNDLENLDVSEAAVLEITKDVKNPQNQDVSGSTVLETSEDVNKKVFSSTKDVKGVESVKNSKNSKNIFDLFNTSGSKDGAETVEGKEVEMPLFHDECLRNRSDDVEGRKTVQTLDQIDEVSNAIETNSLEGSEGDANKDALSKVADCQSIKEVIKIDQASEDDPIKKMPVVVLHNKEFIHIDTKDSTKSSDGNTVEMNSFKTPPSSPPCQSLIIKTPVVVLHDLKLNSPTGSIDSDKPVKIGSEFEVLPKVKEADDDDDDSVIDLVSDCEVLSDSSDGAASDSEQDRPATLADILEEILPKQISTPEVKVDDSKMGPKSIIVDSVNVSGLQAKVVTEEKSDTVSSGLERKDTVSSGLERKDTTSRKNILDILHRTLINRSQGKQSEHKTLSRDETQVNSLDLKQVEAGVVKAADVKKDQSVMSSEEKDVDVVENEIGQSKGPAKDPMVTEVSVSTETEPTSKESDKLVDTNVVETSVASEPDKAIKDTPTTEFQEEQEEDVDVVEVLDSDEEKCNELKTMTMETGGINANKSVLEARDKPKKSERNLFDLVSASNAPLKTPTKDDDSPGKDTNISSSGAPGGKGITNISSSGAPTGKGIQRATSPDWKSALSQIRKKIDLKLLKEKESVSDVNCDRRRHESEPVAKSTSHNDGNEQTNVAYDGKQDGNLEKKRYRSQSETLTDFDDFVPESNLDVVDISQPGRKKYPMRSTARRLLRIVETNDEDYAQDALEKDDKEEKEEAALDVNEDKDDAKVTRGRGRPRSRSAASSESSGKHEEEAALDVNEDKDDYKVIGVRRRGRPRSRSGARIVETNFEDSTQEVPEKDEKEEKEEVAMDVNEDRDDAKVTRRRGRPRSRSAASSESSGKHEEEDIEILESPTENKFKKGRGRQLGWKKLDNKSSKDASKVSSEPRRSSRQVHLQEEAEKAEERAKVEEEEKAKEEVRKAEEERKAEEQKKAKEERESEEAPAIKRGRGRPRKQALHEIIDITDDTEHERNSGRRLSSARSEEDSDEVSEEEIIERRVTRRRGRLSSARSEEHSDDVSEEEIIKKRVTRRSLRSMEETEDVDVEKVEMSASGRLRKIKVQMDFIQVGDDVQSDDDDFIVEETKSRGRSRKTKRVGSLSWRKDKSGDLDPDWSPDAGDDTSSKKAATKKSPNKSPVRLGRPPRGMPKPFEERMSTKVVGDGDEETYNQAMKDLGEITRISRERLLVAISEQIQTKSPKVTEKIEVSKVSKGKLSDSLPLLTWNEDRPLLNEKSGLIEKARFKDSKYGQNDLGEVEGMDTSEAVATSVGVVNQRMALGKAVQGTVQEQNVISKDDNIIVVPWIRTSNVNLKTGNTSSMKPVDIDAGKDKQNIVSTEAPLHTVGGVLDLSTTKNVADAIQGSTSSSNAKAIPLDCQLLASSDMSTPKKQVCVPQSRTSPILLTYLTNAQDKEKASSPEVIEIKDNSEVFIPTVSPTKLHMPRHPVLSPPLTPKLPRIPNSPIMLSPTHPLPPPQYYTIVQPATKERPLMQPGGLDPSQSGPMRFRGRIRMRGGRVAPPPRSPYFCETRLNRPPAMQVIPTLSPLHQMQSLQTKVVVQKDYVMNDSGLVVSGNTLQPVQQLLNSQNLNLSNPFQITPAVQQPLVVQRFPVVTPIQTVAPSTIQIVAGPHGLIQATVPQRQVTISPPTVQVIGGPTGLVQTQRQVTSPVIQMIAGQGQPRQVLVPHNQMMGQISTAQGQLSMPQGLVSVPQRQIQQVSAPHVQLSMPQGQIHRQVSVPQSQLSQVSFPQGQLSIQQGQLQGHVSAPPRQLSQVSVPQNRQFIQTMPPRGNSITVHVSSAQPVFNNPPIVNRPITVQHPAPTLAATTVSTSVMPQVSTIPNMATTMGSGLLPTTTQLVASGIIPNQGIISTAPIRTVEPIRPTTPTATDRQHYVSILRQYSNSLRPKNQAASNLVYSGNQAANQVPVSSNVVTHGPRGQQMVSHGHRVQQTSVNTSLLNSLPNPNIVASIPVRTPGPLHQLQAITTQNQFYTPSRSASPSATNVLHSLAQQHLTDTRHIRPAIAPKPPVTSISKDHGIYGKRPKNSSKVGTSVLPGPSGHKATSSNQLVNQAGDNNQLPISTNAVTHGPRGQQTSEPERLSGAKKRKTAHIGSKGGFVWFDDYGCLHGATEQLSVDELIEINKSYHENRSKEPSSLVKPRTKVPTFGPSRDAGRAVLGGPADGMRRDGMIPSQSAPLLRTHIVPKKRHDKWAAPLPPPIETKVPETSALSDLESTEQLTVLSDFDHDEKMSLPAEEEDDTPSLLMQLMEAESKRPKIDENKENEQHLVFEVTSDDGFSAKGNSMEEAWGKVIQKVEERRSDTKMTNLSFAGINPLKILGVSHDAMIFLIEQLYGASNCRDYKFRYHQYYDAEMEEEPEINPHGTARAETFKTRTYYDMFNFLASRHRKRPKPTNADGKDDTMHKSARRATSIPDLPMAMRFRHLKETAKEAVGVYRSRIHGRGLFCKRTIDAGEMIIEYTGTVIRSILTDKREKYYESKGIGCYMFRIDDYDVIDATMHGSAARFINHSCEPNCFSRVIQVGTSKHIVIFASRKIYTGEELTYDYKFPIEEVKIPCNCLAPRCRKYLN